MLNGVAPKNGRGRDTFALLLFGGRWCYGVVAGVLPQPHFDNVISCISPQGPWDIVPSLQQGLNLASKHHLIVSEYPFTVHSSAHQKTKKKK